MTKEAIDQAMLTATQLHQAGRLADAERAYRNLLAHNPNHAGAMHHLGIIAHQVGKNDIAVEIIRRAIKLRPNFAEAYNNLGVALSDQKMISQAIEAYRMAIRLKPDYADAHSNLGNALRMRNELDEAALACQTAIRLNPAHADAYCNLGAVYHAQEKLHEAIAASLRAIEINPRSGQAYSNLGATLHSQSKLDEAMIALRQAIQIEPAHADAHRNLGLVLLSAGEFAAGWREQEWRWKCKDFPSPVRNFSQPLWLGENVVGRRVLLHAEQGLGDTIQFVRYASQVTARGATVILECPPELFRLLKDLPGIHQTIIAGQSLPEFDLHCPLLSLPLAFGTQLESIPSSIPYVSADSQQVQSWADEIADESRDLKVGLVWAGSPIHTKNKRRSMELRQFSPLSAVRGMKFYSLQKGASAEQVHDPDVGLKLIDLTHKLNDFSDTAALIANLDLVITVDTAVAHLAGAMGKPVWVLLPFVPDWRWMMDREDSPWYPTMRLFRQKVAGQWDKVIERVADSLAKRCKFAASAERGTA